MGESINNWYDSSAATGVYDKYSGTYKKTASEDDKNTLGQDDFLKLIIEQFKNQDFNNATSNTEFMQQMSQFSTLNAVQEITKAVEGMTEQFEAMSYFSNANFATTLVGKNVTVAFDNEDGSMGTDKGVVETVSLVDGTPAITVNGKQYSLSNVMEVNQTSQTNDGASQSDGG